MFIFECRQIAARDCGNQSLVLSLKKKGSKKHKRQIGYAYFLISMAVLLITFIFDFIDFFNGWGNLISYAELQFLSFLFIRYDFLFGLKKARQNKMGKTIKAFLIYWRIGPVIGFVWLHLQQEST